MKLFRSIVIFCLVLVTVLFVGFGGSNFSALAARYSNTQIEQVQKYASRLQVLRDRMSELEPFIKEQNRNEVKAFIRGPLGDLGTRFSAFQRSLSPKDKAKASRNIAEIYDHLVKLDQATDAGDSDGAMEQYQSAIEDFDLLLQLAENLQ
jgi:photosystem II protein PsbQ